MLKIHKRNEKRKIELKDFLKIKEDGEFKKFRTISKSVNFLFIFGGSPKVFVESALETAWSHKQCEEFIKANKLETLRENVLDRYKKETSEMIDYLTCADFMRKGFFKSYPGLMDRILRNKELAQHQGFIRSVFGAVRRLPELFMKGSQDEHIYGKMFRNLLNISTNTDIQNFETGIVDGAIIELEDFMKDKKSKIFNTVHDSMEFYVHKSEVKEVCEKILETCRKLIPELKDLAMDVDITVSDLGEGDWYKHGRNWQYYSEKYKDYKK